MGADVVTLGATFVPLIDQLDSSPQRVAVSGPEGTLTYAELSLRAGRLARRLRRIGVTPGDHVGLCVNRSINLVVATMAVLKADGVYVAIDPTYPDERIRWMLDDSAAVAVVADAGTADRLGTFGERPRIVVTGAGELAEPSDRDGGDSGGDGPAGQRCGPTDLAYIVYTSGSTGQPKGVMVEHAGLANLIDWHRSSFGLGADDRCTQIASPGFDAAAWEIWPCLAAGASLHIVPENVRLDPLRLRDWLVAEGITVTFLPTAVAEGLMGLAWPHETAMRYLLTGGEALTRRPPAGLGFTVVNNYGLSETTVVATSGAVAEGDTAGDRGQSLPSIGTAITGATAEVVDEDLRPVTPGEAGELLIGGVVVGRGYLNRPDLTAERFLDGPQGRRYRTGDRVRLRPDGEIEFLGRLDDQVSIRGFRVEPAEVDATLQSHPGIRSSVTVGLRNSTGHQQLVSYLVSSGTDRPDPSEMNGFLGRFLPVQLLPSKYVWLDELPLTAHGKIDRGALPAPVEAATTAVGRGVGAVGTNGHDVHDGGDGDEGAGEGGSEERPRTETEAAIAPVLTELLDVAEIGGGQNFFLLGGHSMLGAQLIVRLEKLFGVEITLRFLFDHPTLEEIAAEVDRQTAAGEVMGSSTG
ncbi:MAG TPA: non-ribosomal peptide synthetase [Acidimicrobiales bacterium]|nr:non-ribosomal peptide synthetase [Acidimicrobiales bacterium]